MKHLKTEEPSVLKNPKAPKNKHSRPDPLASNPVGPLAGRLLPPPSGNREPHLILAMAVDKVLDGARGRDIPHRPAPNAGAANPHDRRRRLRHFPQSRKQRLPGPLQHNWTGRLLMTSASRPAAPPLRPAARPAPLLGQVTWFPRRPPSRAGSGRGTGRAWRRPIARGAPGRGVARGGC